MTHPAGRHPDLLIGVETGDDAGVYALGDGRVLVQTIDIFTPVVDSPYDWGRIAAANALSDVYAMGAIPLTALQFLAWPREELPFEVAGDVLKGGMDVMGNAGCTVVGGHSIDGPEPVFGFAVTGTTREESLVSNGGALPGDALVLSKPLGIGVVTTAIKRRRCPEDLAAEAIEVMATLNDRAAATAVAMGVHAMTDITGFGLLGHLREMLATSNVGASIRYSDVPVLPGVVDLLAEGMWAGGSQRNLEAVEPEVASEIEHVHLKVLADAQTSGGLLAAMDPSAAGAFVREVQGSAVIGEVVEGQGMKVLS